VEEEEGGKRQTASSIVGRSRLADTVGHTRSSLSTPRPSLIESRDLLYSLKVIKIRVMKQGEEDFARGYMTSLESGEFGTGLIPLFYRRIRLVKAVAVRFESYNADIVAFLIDDE